jgi:hypothetical protein
MVTIKLKGGKSFNITEYTYAQIQSAITNGKPGFTFIHFPKEKTSLNVKEILYIKSE